MRGLTGLKPLADRMLVRVLAQDQPQLVYLSGCPHFVRRGLVLATGPGTRTKRGALVPMDVHEGQVVRFGQFTDFEEDDLVVIRQPDVLVIEEGGQA